MKKSITISTKDDLSRDPWITYFAAVWLIENAKKKKIEITNEYDWYWLTNIVESVKKYSKFSTKQQRVLNNIVTKYFYYLKGVTLDYENIIDQPWHIEPKSDDYKKLPLHMPKQFIGKLRDFQVDAVKYCVSNRGRALIADPMGSGKTIEAIATAEKFKRYRPVLVICPAIVKYSWAEQLLKFVDNPTIYVIEGMPKEGIKSPFNEKFLYHEGNEDNVYIIINYDLLAPKTYKVKKGEGENKETKINKEGWLKYLVGTFRFLILDEAHKIKNEKAKRSKAVFRLMQEAEKVLALTGTPIIRNIVDLYHVIHHIRPDLVKGKTAFFRRYVEYEFNGFGHVPVGVKEDKLDELKALLSHIIIRREKSEILKDLPEKMQMVLPVKLQGETAEEYNKAVKEFEQWYLENKGKKLVKGKALVKLEVLKQICAKGKIDYVVDWTTDYLESDEKNKIVIFAHHTDIINTIQKRLSKSYKTLKLIGSMGSSKLHEVAKEFAEDKNARAIVCSILATGIGINELVVADTGLFVELPWNSVDLDQAEDRLHRMGQLSTTQIYYLIAMGTIDEYLIEILDEKRKQIETVLTDKSKEEIEKDTLKQLLNRLFRGKMLL